MTNHQINLGVQIIPIADAAKCYPIIDQCIALIQQSGIAYQVTAFETILEGPYEELMSLIDLLYELALSMSEELVINIRLHAKNGQDVFGTDKTAKFNQ
ncbi:MAG: thiamine-binding protein [Roseivirga sp.]|nr:thiamine-binding protein [Roseivirga sp.]